MGDRVAELAAARRLIIQQVAPITQTSRIYESAAWGDAPQPYFLNQALVLRTKHTPRQLLASCLDIERQLGRRRRQPRAPRNIDIDMLYFGQYIIEEENLYVPHPEIEKRRFTLVPMVEIAPEWIHPVLKKRQDELLAACTDMLEVRPFLC